MESEWQRQLVSENATSKKATHSYRLKIRKAFVFLQGVHPEISSCRWGLNLPPFKELLDRNIWRTFSDALTYKDGSQERERRMWCPVGCTKQHLENAAIIEWMNVIRAWREERSYVSRICWDTLSNTWMTSSRIGRSAPVVMAPKEEGAYRGMSKEKTIDWEMKSWEIKGKFDGVTRRCLKELKDRVASNKDGKWFFGTINLGRSRNAVFWLDMTDAVILLIIGQVHKFRQTLMREGVSYRKAIWSLLKKIPFVVLKRVLNRSIE